MYHSNTYVLMIYMGSGGSGCSGGSRKSSGGVGRVGGVEISGE